MLYSMICKQHRHEEKRFWFCQERQFVMPVLEKQIMPVRICKTSGYPYCRVKPLSRPEEAVFCAINSESAGHACMSPHSTNNGHRAVLLRDNAVNDEKR